VGGWVDKGDLTAAALTPMLDFGTKRSDIAMDTFLTLVIALGGIATGIGAIWTAMLTRRHLGEQNERARLNMAVDLLFRCSDRFNSPFYLNRRRAAAEYLLDNAFGGDDTVEVESLNHAGWDVCGFFEDLGHLQRIEALPAETVWNSFGSVLRTCWPLSKLAIEKLRKEWGAQALYEEFEHLSGVLADLERERGIEPPEKGALRRVLEGEAHAGEEPTTKAE
jgi:hypothetical protein